MKLSPITVRAWPQRRVWLRFLVGALLLAAAALRATTSFEQPVQEVSASMLEIAARYRAQHPQVGDLAADFRLTGQDGSSEVALSDFRGQRPIVLVFGSYTCPVFRQRAASLNEAYDKYKDRAEFLFIYIREAHPEEDGHIPENEELVAVIPRAKTLADRVHVAQLCVAALRIRMPILVDHMDNSTAQSYNAWPERLYVIDAEGRIAYNGNGPGDVNVPAMTRALQRLL